MLKYAEMTKLIRLTHFRTFQNTEKLAGRQKGVIPSLNMKSPKFVSTFSSWSWYLNCHHLPAWS